MGSKMSIVEKVEMIFHNHDNFDESGFCDVNLIKTALAEELGHIDISDQKKLERLGYEFSWFNAQDGDGMIRRWFKEKHGVSYCLKLYFNQNYPKENERRRLEDEQRFVRTGSNQQSEEDHSGAEEDC